MNLQMNSHIIPKQINTEAAEHAFIMALAYT